MWLFLDEKPLESVLSVYSSSENAIILFLLLYLPVRPTRKVESDHGRCDRRIESD